VRGGSIRVALLVGLAGCTLGPNYERPAVPVPDAWRIPPDAGDSLAAVRWWDLFQDDVLRDLIRIALEENKDLRTAAARVDEASAQARLTRADQLPRLDGTAQYSRLRFSHVATRPALPPNFDTEQDQWTLNLQAGYEVDLWGRLRRATEAARAQLLATEAVRRTVVISLVSGVAQAYFDLLDLDEELRIAGEALETRREALRILRLRRDAGITADLDLARAEEEEAGTAAVIPDLEQRIVQTEHGLRVLLGRNPGGIPRGRGLTEQVLPPAVPAGLPSELLERRPDILEAEQQLVAANANVGVAKATFLPRITLTGAFGLQSFSLADLFTIGASQAWSIGPQVSVPVYTGGRRDALVDAAEARKVQALQAYGQAVQQAFREVEDALIAHRKIGEARVHHQRELAAARRYLDLAQRRFLNGLASYLDVLDAQRQLFSDQIDGARSLRAHLSAIVQLYKALGGGWAPDAPQAAR